MQVTTTTLELRTPSDAPPRAFPPEVRLDLASGISPEYARFLYGLVGGPWHWTDRLGWSRRQWAAELAWPGTEFWVLAGGGVPLGYVQLRPEQAEPGTTAPGTTELNATERGTAVEVRYFGLAESAIGRGLGGRLLEHGIRAAWTLPDRTPMARVTRVWVHTCTLDGPAALANYRARGFEIVGEATEEQAVSDHPLGAWVATGGPMP